MGQFVAAWTYDSSITFLDNVPTHQATLLKQRNFIGGVRRGGRRSQAGQLIGYKSMRENDRRGQAR